MIGIGYEFAGPSWMFPERDEKGEIIGLVRRFYGGKKYTMEGSKRGLTYIMNPDFGKKEDRYTPGRHNWVRVSKGTPCPICGREKWCLISAEDIDNPPAVLCGQEEGSIAPSGEGTFLHILTPDGIKDTHCQTVLPDTELPILIVEGQTDVAAAYDLGLVAIGRPSATSGMKLLRKMPLNNRSIIVVGENDAGAGEDGMESAHRTLNKMTQKIISVMPTDGIKDLRTWVHAGLTRDLLLAKADEAPTVPASDIFPNDVAHTIAKDWMQRELLVDGYPTIRLYKGRWLNYKDSHYQEQDVNFLRGMLYRFLDGKLYERVDANGVIIVEPYRPTRAKVGDIFDALNQWCHITKEHPTWLDDEYHPDIVNSIPFQNGILNVDDYMDGKITMIPNTPAYFNMNVLPYDFDPELESEEWNSFLADIFNKSQGKINLLAEWMGYNCVPDISQEKMMIFTGRPRSGKSTVLEAMRHMLGLNQCCETSFQSLCGAFGYQPLEGKLAALIGDAKTPTAGQADAALEKLLQIVGGDPVTINRKGVSQLASVQLRTRFSVAMNELPVFADHASALEVRLNLLHFSNSYVGREDRFLKYRLNKEADAGRLINFALRGLKRLREQKKFTLPPSSVILHNEFRALSSPIHEFVAECCELHDTTAQLSKEEYWTPSNMLYELWRGWSKMNGRAAGIKAQFYQRLMASYPTLVRDRKRIAGESSARYVICGVKINDEVKLMYL